MEKKYNIKEILDAVQDLQDIKNETITKAKNDLIIKKDNSDIPPNTLKLIEEAEKFKSD
tara:strand:- start:318 stop:494 length:177 start_codon:yes stop_codon:yes gene_type:complete